MENFYSQNGEDGIIRAILFELESSGLPSNSWCCEFGAWDGKHLSNTFNLIKNVKYNSVLIEPDPKKFHDLRNNLASFANQNLFNEFVGLEKNNNFEFFLHKAGAPKDFDLLSIDIDGMDYWVLDTMEEFRPKIICIEYNQSIPFDVSYIQEKSFLIKHGSSAKAISELGTRKGYTVVAITASNLILLDTNLAKVIKFNMQTDLMDLAPELSPEPTYIFSGYDGSLLTSGILELKWHGIYPEIDSIQYLPKSIRHFPDDFTRIQAFLFKVFRSRIYLRKNGLKLTLNRIIKGAEYGSKG